MSKIPFQALSSQVPFSIQLLWTLVFFLGAGIGYGLIEFYSFTYIQAGLVSYVVVYLFSLLPIFYQYPSLLLMLILGGWVGGGFLFFTHQPLLLKEWIEHFHFEKSASSQLMFTLVWTILAALIFGFTFLFRKVIAFLWSKVAETFRHITPRNEHEKWLLAVSANYVEINQDILKDGAEKKELERFWRLDMGCDEEEAVQCVETLEEWWNIADQETAIETLEWLIDEGDRKDFKSIAEALARDENPLQEEDENGEQKIDVVRQYAPSLGRCGILGWDLIRYYYVIRMCFVAGYLSTKECWDLFEKAEPLIQREGKSWKDLLQQYWVGFAYWGGEEIDERKVLIERMLHHPESPYVKIPFRSFQSLYSKT